MLSYSVNNTFREDEIFWAEDFGGGGPYADDLNYNHGGANSWAVIGFAVQSCHSDCIPLSLLAVLPESTIPAPLTAQRRGCQNGLPLRPETFGWTVRSASQRVGRRGKAESFGARRVAEKRMNALPLNLEVIFKVPSLPERCWPAWPAVFSLSR